MDHLETQHLIIGSGLAGMALALKLADKQPVTLIAKGQLDQSATSWAQGGIASAAHPDDSFENHIADTLAAGGGLCHPDVVRFVVEGGPAAIADLIEYGVDFTKSPDSMDENGETSYHLHREGGHSARRVYHAHDMTGREIVRALIERCRRHPNIAIHEDTFAIDLVTTDKYSPDFSENRCLGAYLMNRQAGAISLIRSARTYLCTGGHGKVYLYTSNPDSATGDGLAMGWRAGAKVANLEFMQFHPTCLFVSAAKNFLISEAVRGEGGVIRNRQGEDFTREFDERGSLAPRDIVARAIDMELKRSGESNVFLDVTHLGKRRIEELFPNIYNTCLQHGIDPATEMIPVVPAAHYSCGGLVVNMTGETTVRHLYALGEVACTGLHGANRLASNSLLEAVVFAGKVAATVNEQGPLAIENVTVPQWHSRTAVPNDELVMLSHTWDEIRRLMWHYVGIVRSERRLQRAIDRITALRMELDQYYWDYHVTSELIEVRNLAQVAWLTIRSAIARKESRGIHYNIDFPERDDTFHKKDTIIF